MASLPKSFVSLLAITGCAAGLAALDVLFQDKLAQRAGEKGTEFVEKLQGLVGHGGLKGVRGRGLLIGLDFTTAQATQSFVQICFANGLVLGWTLHEDTVVRLAPPLVISSAQIDQAIAVMRDALDQSLRDA